MHGKGIQWLECCLASINVIFSGLYKMEVTNGETVTLGDSAWAS